MDIPDLTNAVNTTAYFWVYLGVIYMTVWTAIFFMAYCPIIDFNYEFLYDTYIIAILKMFSVILLYVVVCHMLLDLNKAVNR